MVKFFKNGSDSTTAAIRAARGYTGREYVVPVSYTHLDVYKRQGVDFVLSNLALMDGGEIFIPKIPSMKIVDLAHVLKKDIKTHVIGIRPGEKLHEWMLTSDESLQTVEIEDRYVVLPSFQKSWNALKNSKKISERLVYSSETNSEWLTESQLKEMI